MSRVDEDPDYEAPGRSDESEESSSIADSDHTDHVDSSDESSQESSKSGDSDDNNEVSEDDDGVMSTHSTSAPTTRSKRPKRALSDSEDEDVSQMTAGPKAKEKSSGSETESDHSLKLPAKRIRKRAEESSEDEGNLTSRKRTRRNFEHDPNTPKGKKMIALTQYQLRREKLTPAGGDMGKIIVQPSFNYYYFSNKKSQGRVANSLFLPSHGWSEGHAMLEHMPN